MSAQLGTVMSKRGRPSARAVVACLALLVVLAAIAVDTKVVRIDAAGGVAAGVFSPAAYGKSEFPKVQAEIEGRAVDAATIAKDSAVAGKDHGVQAGAGPEIPIKFTGVVGKEDSGVYDVAIDGVPSTVTVRVQTGPAINGTDLRDSTGTINFGQFTNQIEYQNAGSALNKEMKKQVLSKIDATKLAGKTISVIGVFQLIDPQAWLVTPVRLDVR